MLLDDLRDGFLYLFRGENYAGADGIPVRMLEHVAMSVATVAIAAALALPVALWLGHLGKGGTLAINVSNAGRAVPTFALLILLAVSPLGFGYTSTVVTLVVFAIPPILTNAYVGMRGVDADVREASSGMGMSSWQQLRGVELPLALPLIAAGIRTATVQVIATATLAALIGAGGLGRYIVDGYGRQDYGQVYAGVYLVVALALAAEVGLGRLQRRLTPGRSQGKVRDPETEPAEGTPGGPEASEQERVPA